MPLISPTKRRKPLSVQSRHTFQKSIQKGNRKTSIGNGTPIKKPSSSPSVPTPSRLASRDRNRLTGQVPSVIIFDWDDTLLCSSVLAEHGYSIANSRLVDDATAAGLEALSATVQKVLKLALSTGSTVLIVTNAETNWVELSARKFMPGCLDLIQKHRIRVVSARSSFEDFYPDEPLAWKEHCFREETQRALDAKDSKYGQFRQILSLGDSQSERLAAQTVSSELGLCCKSVKFVQSPSIAQLMQQLRLVVNCFGYLQTHKGPLDLMLTVQQDEPDAESTESDDDSEDDEEDDDGEAVEKGAQDHEE